MTVSSRPPADVKLSNYLVQALIGSIINGAYSAGDAFPCEAELCAQYLVARSSIREAIRVLETKGLLEVKHGIGTRVARGERWNFLDADVLHVLRSQGATQALLCELDEVGELIERETAALAVKRADDFDRERLEATIVQMETSIEDEEAFSRADAAFHQALFESAGNQILRRLLAPVSELCHLHFQDKESRDRVLSAHRATYRTVCMVTQ